MANPSAKQWYPTAAYLYVLHLDGLALAWEYLRRHPDYRRDWLHRRIAAVPAGATDHHRWRHIQLIRNHDTANARACALRIASCTATGSSLPPANFRRHGAKLVTRVPSLAL